MGPRAFLYRLRCRLHRRDVSLWYDPRYRLPLSGIEAAVGMEPRRADFAAWWLIECGAVPAKRIRTPQRIPFSDLARVHTAELLESLGRPEALATIYAVDPSDVPVDPLMATVRLACGATLGAARETLATRAPALNLLGGFHHAGPGSAGGFCPVNDIAVAIAALRSEGFLGTIAVVDVDAHPPDGIAACLAADHDRWIGSISASDWGGTLEGVDETVLPDGAGDGVYLDALGEMLGRMPRPALAFVIAGGDVLAGDRFGKLGLTLEGVRLRDLLVAIELEGVPTVWLPGGGYHRDAWRVLAGTGMAVAAGSLEPIPASYDPLVARFAGIAASLSHEKLSDTSELTVEDLEEDLGLRAPRQRLLLGYYTESGIDHGLFRYGIYAHLQRLGFANFRVELDLAGAGERIRVFGDAGGAEHLLMETILEKRRVASLPVLFTHWLSLRNPRAEFSDRRPRLPGQDVPGLGLAREVGTMLSRMAVRLGLAGVVFRPAHYHTAYTGRHDFAFVDPERQGRFEAMVRDLAAVSLLEATTAVAEGHVRLNGAPYAWEPDEMALWLRDDRIDTEARRSAQDRIAAERERCRFTIAGEPARDATLPPADVRA